MMLSSHLILCCPLLLLPSHFPNIKVFSKESSLLMRWPKYWSLSFRICPSSEHSGLIFFRIDRLVLLAVQGTLKSLLQHHNSKALLSGALPLFNTGQASSQVLCCSSEEPHSKKDTNKLELKLQEARFRLNIRKNFLTVRAVRQWNQSCSDAGGIQEKVGQPSVRSALIWIPALSRGLHSVAL